MGRFTGVVMTALTRYILKNFNTNVIMNVNLSYFLERASKSPLKEIDVIEYHKLARDMGLDYSVYSSIYKEHYQKLLELRDKYHIRSIKHTLDLVIAHFLETCKTSNTPECERMRKILGNRPPYWRSISI